MPRTAVFEGTRYQVPDDATNDEIASFVESQLKSKPPTPGMEKLGGQPPAAGRPPQVKMKKDPLSAGGIALGAAKGLGRDLYSTATAPSRAMLKLEGINAPGLEKPSQAIEKMTEPKTASEELGRNIETGGSLAATGAGLFGAASKGIQALRAGKVAAQGVDAAAAVASKIPKVHPFAKFLAKRIPGVGTALDMIEALKTTEAPPMPKAGRDELAAQLWKETTGRLPETAKEKVQAIKGLREALKPPAAAKEKYPPSKSLAHELYEETHGEAPRGAEKKIQAIKDLRKAMKEPKGEAKATAAGAGEAPIAKTTTAKIAHNQGPLQKAARILVDGGYGPDEARTILKTLGTSEQDIVETIANMRTLGK